MPSDAYLQQSDLKFSRRPGPPPVVATPLTAPDMLPLSDAAVRGTPVLRTPGGRLEILTEWGRACRLGGCWFIDGTAVTVPSTVAWLDNIERRHQ